VTQAGEPVAKAQEPRGGLIWSILGQYGTLIVLGGLFVTFSVAEPKAFPTSQNLLNVLNQVALQAIIAGGVTLVLVANEFDLSIGYQASFAGVIATGLIAFSGLPIPVAVCVAILVGAVIGLCNGLIVTKLGVNALIATLGTGTVVVGINYAYSQGQPIILPLNTEFTQLSLARLLGVPIAVWIMAFVLVALWALLNHTPLGQNMQAVGGNREAAGLAGVRVHRTIIYAFVITGMCAALTGVLLAARLGSGQITGGDGYLLNAFAAVFLGSAALRDGEFHILGTFIGVLTVGVGLNGISIMGAPIFINFVFSGALLIGAVALSTLARRYGPRARRGY
jgi:ribose transport system permease protein